MFPRATLSILLSHKSFRWRHSIDSTIRVSSEMKRQLRPVSGGRVLESITQGSENVMAKNIIHMKLSAELHLAWHSHTTIKSQYNTIQHDILDALRDKLCEFVWLARPHCTSLVPNFKKGCCPMEVILNLTRELHNSGQTRSDLITHHASHTTLK